MYLTAHPEHSGTVSVSSVTPESVMSTLTAYSAIFQKTNL